MICGVPKLQLGEEIKKLIEPYGCIKQIHIIPEYPTEEFTEAYYVKYARIQSARIAKRFIDGKNFYGGSLHVFYVPELETLTETKAKLTQRRRDVLIRIKKNQQDAKDPNIDKFIPKKQFHRKKRTPALPLTEERLTQHYPGETLSSIYNGIPQNIDPRPISEPSLPSTSYNHQEDAIATAPYHLTETIIKTAKFKETVIKSDYTRNKRKNYKGQSVNDNVKVKIVRPQLIDTSAIVKWDTSTKNLFSNPRKIENNITIKLMSNSNDKKKIVIKNPSVSHLVQPSEDLQLSIKEAKSQVTVAENQVFKVKHY
nr:PREDICTED: uncharacterized protein LOC100879115 isoform X2 [Megachile rotundata]XP_012141062.1 PREDICTED: uncharacterized protein LOC100879115 isoform X2 [Megachile rotundata]XP_012141063.1 PREDICTED: uncharacterized protein LOC100879115 isoform X2 [Megachile rotundata]